MSAFTKRHSFSTNYSNCPNVYSTIQVSEVNPSFAGGGLCAACDFAG